MTSKPIVATKNLVKRFKDQIAVNEVSLTVNQGDVYGFLGLNGAGKTTSLRLLMGLLRPDAGSISLFGATSRQERRAAMSRIGAMVESPSFYSHLSGAKNLELLGSLGGPLPKGRVEEVLGLVGLKDVGNKKAKHFSLGMKQRLAIGLALLGDPELVVLDEPANGLDPNGILEMRHLIRRLNEEQGTTFIVSSHLLYEIELMCNRIVILEKGRVLYQGPTEEFGRKGTPRYRVTGTDEETLNQLLSQLPEVSNVEAAPQGGLTFQCKLENLPTVHRQIADAELAIFTMEEEKISLEEFFLEQTGDGAVEEKS